MQEKKNIIESLLFAAEEPLTVEKLRTILETADGKEIQNALKALSDEYDQRNGGFMLREIAGGWQIRSRPEYNEWIKRMLQPSPQRLSRAALETLAVIAYKQPIIRADIEHIRGVDCGGVLRQLMERKIIRVLGRKEIAGRPLIYATTKLFLEMFDLKDLNDLPTPKEIAELGNAMIDSQQAAAEKASLAEAQSPSQPTESDQEYASVEDDTSPMQPAQASDAAPSATPADPASTLRQETDATEPYQSMTEPAIRDDADTVPEAEEKAAVEAEDERLVDPHEAASDHEEEFLQPEQATIIPASGRQNTDETEGRKDWQDDDGANATAFDREPKNT